MPVPEPPAGTTTGWLAEVWEAMMTGLFGTQLTNLSPAGAVAESV